MTQMHFLRENITFPYSSILVCEKVKDLIRYLFYILGLLFSTLVPSEEPDDEEYIQADLQNMAYDGLENLAGYICHKLKHEVPDIALSTDMVDKHSWVDHLSEGGLSKPTDSFMLDMQALHVVFNKINGSGLFISKNYLGQHLQQAAGIECNLKVKKLFFRSRMYFRMRILNKELADLSTQRKRKMHKILK